MDQLSLDLVLDTSQATQSSNAYFQTFEQNVQKLNSQLDSLAKPRQLQFRVAGQETLDGAAKKVRTIEENTQRVKERVATLNGEWGKTPEQIRGQVRYLQEVQAKTTKYRDETGLVSQGWIKVNQKVQEGLALLRQKTNGGFLDQTNQLTGTIAGRVATLNGEWGKTPQQIKGQVQYLQQVLDRTTKYNSKTGQLTTGWQKVNARVNEGLDLLRKRTDGGFLEQTRALLTPLTAKFALANFAATAVIQIFNKVVGSVVAIGQAAVKRAGQVQALKLALEGIVPPQQEVNDVLRAAVTDSLEYGVSLTEVEKAYKRLTPAIVNSGGTMQDVRDVIVSLSARSTELGLNTEQSGRYMEAFAQVMGKGKLQAEELNQQFAELDGALRVQIAQYLQARYGITDLNDAMKRGRVTADLFREAFVAISEDAVERLKQNIGQLSQSIFTMGEKGGATINQLDQQFSTLWQITLKNTAAAFEPLVEYFYAMQAAVLQFTATFASDFPMVTQLVSVLAEAVGYTLYAAFVLIITTLEMIASGLELVMRPMKAFFDLIYNRIPGGKQLVEGLGRVFQFLKGVIPGVVDQTNDLSGTTEVLTGQLNNEKVTLEDLNTAYAAGKISANQYATGVENIKNAEEEVIRNGYIQALEQRKQELKENIQKEKDLQREIKDKIREEKQGTREVLAQIRERYRQELQDIRSAKREALAKLDAELARLDAMTPVQKRLQEIRKEKIQEQLRSSELTEEERLQLIDQLQEMDRQDQRRKIKAEKQKISKKAEEDERKIIERQKTEMDKLNKQMARNITELTRMLAQSTTRLTNMERGYTTIDQEIEKAKNGQAEYNVELGLATKVTPNLTSQNTNLANSYNSVSSSINSAATAYKNLAASIREANTARRQTSSQPGRAEGGPVSGGSKYTVNEMGKEAFLSASGRLSMINAPAWGTWRAPSSGTVIPAHLTSQLDIPNGGIDLNSAAMNRGMGQVRTISNIRNGDNISNTVTIQTDRPRQTASDVMVQLAKLKSVRYR